MYEITMKLRFRIPIIKRFFWWRLNRQWKGLVDEGIALEMNPYASDELVN